MSGPATPQEALPWIQDALACGRYIPTTHFGQRLWERNLQIGDVKRAVSKGISCLPYLQGKPTQDGTCWRVTGPTYQDGDVAVGVEAFKDHLGKRIVLCTVFPKG